MCVGRAVDVAEWNEGEQVIYTTVMEGQRQFSIWKPMDIAALNRLARVVDNGVGAVGAEPCLVEVNQGVSQPTEQIIYVFPVTFSRHT
jgi:hypothetical protein